MRFAGEQRRERNYANNGSALGDRGVPQRGGTDIAPGASVGLRWWRIWVPEGHEFIKFNREILVYPAACLPSSSMCMADHLPLRIAVGHSPEPSVEPISRIDIPQRSELPD